MRFKNKALAISIALVCAVFASQASARDHGHRGEGRGYSGAHYERGHRDYDRRGFNRASTSVYVGINGGWGWNGYGRGRPVFVGPRFGPRYSFSWTSWRGGRWFHGHHDGVLAWWWVIGNDWFYYAAPVYPYPMPVYRYSYGYDYPYYSPYEFPPYGLSAPVPQAAPPPPQPSAPAQSWYYCANPKGYYPYVTSCPGGWQATPATPPGAVQGQ